MAPQEDRRSMGLSEQQRIEMSQHLIRKTLEMGGCTGLRAQVDDTTCLVAYPDNPHEWCPGCLMTAAGEMLLRHEGGE